MEFYQDLWNKTRDKLSNNFAESTFNEVFGEVKKVVKVENGIISVLVPTTYLQSKINTVYSKGIADILTTITNQKLRFKFVCEDDLKSTYIPVVNKIRKNNLKTNYTFQSMVVGESNRLSYITAMKVAEQPGVFINPLYIFGGVGLGKTHLMQAIGNYISENDMDANILYVQATDYRSDYFKAIQTHNILEFNEKYENLDVLLIDDIQMLSDASKSQEEFFKLFNDMTARGKQIVITSDCPASKLTGIMPRLTSRFQMGVSVDVHQPDLEQRINILRRKLAETSEISIDVDILRYIAENFTDNVRELEGALTRVLLYCELYNSEPSLELAKESLEILISARKPKQKENYEDVLSVIASFYNISTVDLIGKSRNAKVNLPRQIAMYILYHNYNFTYERIGQILNGRHYSTIISGCEKIENDLQTDIQLKLAVENITKKL